MRDYYMGITRLSFHLPAMSSDWYWEEERCRKEKQGHGNRFFGGKKVWSLMLEVMD